MNKFIKDISGSVYGQLTVIGYNYSNGGDTYWDCLCACGNSISVSKSSLRKGDRKSCGCFVGDYRVRHIGKIFGKLTVTTFVGIKWGSVMWDCVCDCGKRHELSIGQLKKGVICDCEKVVENLSGIKFGKWEVLRKHGNQYVCKCSCGTSILFNRSKILIGFDKPCYRCGKTKLEDHPIYSVLKGMKKRCYDKKNKEYYNYGGRGIGVCDTWMESGWNFINDMGERPSTQHTIDRIDNNGNYCKENCRWATRKEQQNNKRTNRLFEYNGKMINASQLAEIRGVSYIRAYKDIFCNKVFCLVN